MLFKCFCKTASATAASSTAIPEVKNHKFVLVTLSFGRQLTHRMEDGDASGWGSSRLIDYVSDFAGDWRIQCSQFGLSTAHIVDIDFRHWIFVHIIVQFGMVSFSRTDRYKIVFKLKSLKIKITRKPYH